MITFVQNMGRNMNLYSLVLYANLTMIDMYGIKLQLIIPKIIKGHINMNINRK